MACIKTERANLDKIASEIYEIGWDSANYKENGCGGSY
jgi:hypothetical protein